MYSFLKGLIPMGTPDDELANKNVMSKPLPKPVVIGFVVFLILGVVAVPALKFINKLNEPEPVATKPLWRPDFSKPSTSPTSPRQWVDTGQAEQLSEAFEADSELFTRRDSDGWVFVHYAAAACRADLIAAAAELGADLDMTTDLGFTPLHMVLGRALTGFGVTDEEVGLSLFALLDGGADANTHLPGSPAGSPAAWASEYGFSRVLGIFADYGFEPDTAHAPVYETATLRVGDAYETIDPTRRALGLMSESANPDVYELITQYRQFPAHDRVRDRGFRTRQEGRVWFLLDPDDRISEILYWPTPESYLADASPEYVESITLDSSQHDIPVWSNKIGM